MKIIEIDADWPVVLIVTALLLLWLLPSSVSAQTIHMKEGLRWTNPTTYEDGTTIEDYAKSIVWCGPIQGEYSLSMDVPAPASAVSKEALYASLGLTLDVVYYCVVRGVAMRNGVAYTSGGSNEVNFTVPDIRVPAVINDLTVY